MRPAARQSDPVERRAFVLVAVLVVVFLLSLAAYEFSDLMLLEYQAADSVTRSAQAALLADSGVHYLGAALSNSTTLANLLNGNPYNNPGAFQDVVVNPQDQPRLQGRFSVIGLVDPNDPNYASQPYRFGVNDECGKINLNTLMQIDSSGQVAYNVLMNLPNMTDDVANSILDWIDPDDDARTDGAETDYYESLTPAYRAKNGPLDSIEELLMVKGVTSQLLLGNDRNRNGILDSGEDDGTGVTNPGWSAYLTVYSREQNVDSQGNLRIYVNDSDLNTLYQNLSTAVGQNLAIYILAYRLYGPASGAGAGAGPSPTGRAAVPPPAAASAGGRGGGFATGAGATGGAGGGGSVPTQLSQSQLNFQSGRPKNISSLWQLVNSRVTIPASGRQPAATYPSPLNDPATQQQLLPILLDECTTVNSPEIPARVNVNTATQTVLAALPSLADTDVQNILQNQPSPESTDPADPSYQTTAWLVTKASLSPTTLQALDPYITARSQVYRAQVVGYFDRGGPSARLEVVIDTNQGQPRILFWRDLSELGKGFSALGTGTASSPGATSSASTPSNMGTTSNMPTP